MIAHCKDGLCNRMKAIASVVHTTDDYRIVWERVERSLNCDFDQLFDVPPFELLTAKQAKGQARYTGWRLLVHDDDRLPAGFDSLGDKLFGAIPLAGREPRGRNIDLSVIELKRSRTPREVVAQILDYASWVENLSHEDISGMYAEKNDGKKLEEGFADTFGTNPPDELNQSHELIIVASELDPSTERIINYLSDNYGVPVNAVFFRHFSDGEHEYLSRTWLIDPQEAEVKASRASKRKGREPWNGRDFYVSLGEGPHRMWDDCVKYGFISGGGGSWYTKTLDSLFPGARVFVNIPKSGYVGVGEVRG